MESTALVEPLGAPTSTTNAPRPDDRADDHAPCSTDPAGSLHITHSPSAPSSAIAADTTPIPRDESSHSLDVAYDTPPPKSASFALAIESLKSNNALEPRSGKVVVTSPRVENVIEYEIAADNASTDKSQQLRSNLGVRQSHSMILRSDMEKKEDFGLETPPGKSFSLIAGSTPASRTSDGCACDLGEKKDSYQPTFDAWPSRKSFADMVNPLRSFSRILSSSNEQRNRSLDHDETDREGSMIPQRRKTFLGDLSEDFTLTDALPMPLGAISMAISRNGPSNLMYEELGNMSTTSRIRLRVWLYLEDASFTFQSTMMVLIGVAMLLSIHNVNAPLDKLFLDQSVCYRDVTDRRVQDMRAFPCGATLFSVPGDISFAACRDQCSSTHDCYGFVWSPSQDELPRDKSSNSVGVCLYYQEDRYIANSGCGFLSKPAFVFLRASCGTDAYPTDATFTPAISDEVQQMTMTSSCSERAACAERNFTGYCCPNSRGFMLDCCANSSGQMRSKLDDISYHVSWAASILFTVEVVLRWWSYPSRTSFFFQASNVCDVLAVLPFWFLVIVDIGTWKSYQFTYVLETLFRVLKLCRFFAKWEILSHAVRHSAQALTIPLFFVTLMVICFSCTIFMLEVTTLDTFNDAVDAKRIRTLWQAIQYCLVCLISIDVSPVFAVQPRHEISKVLSMIVMVSGVIFMAMPIAVVGNCFSQSWLDRDRIILIGKMRQRMNQKGFAISDLNDIFNEVDKDQSGLIEFPEFKRMVEVFLNMTNPMTVRNLFQTFDVDSSGAITYEGFIGQLFPYISDEEFYRLLQERTSSLDPEGSNADITRKSRRQIASLGFDESFIDITKSLQGDRDTEYSGEMFLSQSLSQTPLIDGEFSLKVDGAPIETTGGDDSNQQTPKHLSAYGYDPRSALRVSGGQYETSPSSRTVDSQCSDWVQPRRQRTSGQEVHRSVSPSPGNLSMFPQQRIFGKSRHSALRINNHETPNAQVMRVYQRMLRLEEKLDALTRAVSTMADTIALAYNGQKSMAPLPENTQRRMSQQVQPTMSRPFSQMSNFLGTAFSRRLSAGPTFMGSFAPKTFAKRRSSYTTASHNCTFMRAAEQRHGDVGTAFFRSPRNRISGRRQELSTKDRLDGLSTNEARRLSVQCKSATSSVTPGSMDGAEAIYRSSSVGSRRKHSDFSMSSAWEGAISSSVCRPVAADESFRDLTDISLSTELQRPFRPSNPFSSDVPRPCRPSPSMSGELRGPLQPSPSLPEMRFSVHSRPLNPPEIARRSGNRVDNDARRSCSS
eukprot:GEMP01002061.1.p1 GENE.GEMP01002061.1~~GEMP01002061.1.p1  ORF type:complete len:1284 (+),score=216.26 GEMP01002061.1:117-3968(+)